MSTPFTFSGSLYYPPDVGLAMAAQPFGLTGSFESKNEQELNITGAGTITVSFGTLGDPGAKGLLIEVDPSGVNALIIVNINGGTDNIEISPGGFMALGSPSPVDGITELDIVSTTANKVRIRIIG